LSFSAANGLPGALLALVCGIAPAQDVHVHVAPGNRNSPDDAQTFATIQYAMDHAPQPGPGGRLYVHLADGIYAERVMVTENRPRTTLLGNAKDPSKVVMTGAQNAQSAGGTFFTATVHVQAPGFEADGITFANTAGNTGQAVAIAVRSDRAVFKHCRFLGDQDTLFADFGRQYYTDSYITGGVDFIFGNAAAVFDKVEIHEQRPAYLTAQSRTSNDQTTGYVITHSSVTASDLGGKSFYLGRPWRAFARVVVMETSLPEQLAPQGWSPWRPGEMPAHAFYAEYNNTGPGASPATRVSWSHQLSAEEAQQFTPSNFLRGSDDWNPIAAAAALP
jgi:pectinesterase